MLLITTMLGYELRRTYTVRQKKKQDTNLMSVTSPLLTTDFQFFSLSDSAANLCNFEHVATLSCEI